MLQADSLPRLKRAFRVGGVRPPQPAEQLALAPAAKVFGRRAGKTLPLERNGFARTRLRKHGEDRTRRDPKAQRARRRSSALKRRPRLPLRIPRPTSTAPLCDPAGETSGSRGKAERSKQ